jgi:hypothetical protein
MEQRVYGMVYDKYKRMASPVKFKPRDEKKVYGSGG